MHHDSDESVVFVRRWAAVGELRCDSLVLDIQGPDIEVHTEVDAAVAHCGDGSVELVIVLDTDTVAIIIDIPKTWTTCPPRSFRMAAKAGNGGLGKREAPRR